MLFSLVGKNPHLLCHCAFKQLNQPIRGVKFLSKIRANSILEKTHRRVVYKFSGIILPVAIIRTKIWIPPVSIALSPVLYIFTESQITAITFALTGLIYGATGLVLSKVVENMVGKIYVNKEGVVKDVMISSVGKKGQRIDRIHQLNDLINYDFPSKIHRTFGFITIGVENSTIVYKLNVNNCKLIDPKACIYLFGNIWHCGIEKQSKPDQETECKEILVKEKCKEST